MNTGAALPGPKRGEGACKAEEACTSATRPLGPAPSHTDSGRLAQGILRASLPSPDLNGLQLQGGGGWVRPRVSGPSGFQGCRQAPSALLGCPEAGHRAKVT